MRYQNVNNPVIVHICASICLGQADISDIISNKRREKVQWIAFKRSVPHKLVLEQLTISGRNQRAV